MSAHLSNEIIERFHSQSLTGGDRVEIYNHILGCEACRRRVVTSQVAVVAVEHLTNHLLPPDGEEPYHLDPATIEAFVDDKLDALDRSTAKLHLEDCAECTDEVTDLRESLATMRAAARQDEIRREEDVGSRRSFRFTSSMRIAAMIAVVAFAALALLAVWRWKFSAPKGSGVDTRAGAQPSPLASPAVPSLAPSPSTLNPSNVAVNPPTLNPESPSNPAVALKDGPNEISIDQSGHIAGLPSLPPDSQQAVKGALSGESLVRPDVLNEVAVAEASTRGGNEDRIRIVSPTRTVILQERPTFRWIPSKAAEAYRLEIADNNFRQVAKSEDLPPSNQTWNAPLALKRGQLYTWTIRGVNKNGELSEITSQGKFKVLGDDGLRELNRLKARRSHLALGLFYAREGMIGDAEREFRILVNDNPNSTIATKLLREVRAWRKG